MLQSPKYINFCSKTYTVSNIMLFFVVVFESSSKKTIRPAVATNVSYLDNNNVIIDNNSDILFDNEINIKSIWSYSKFEIN